MRRKTRKSVKVLALAAGMGAVAGMRSLTAPAVAVLAANRGWIRPRMRSAKILRGGGAAKIASAMAVGEMIVDALPIAPDRRIPPSLGWRIATGALVGAAMTSSERKPVAMGIVAGGLGAVAGTFAGYKLRKELSEQLPRIAAAVTEDAIAVGGGVLLARAA